MRLAVVWLVAASAHADVVVLDAGRDNTLYFSALGTPLSNGAGEHAFAGVNGAGEARRALYWFDLASIPSGATITAASLQLTMSKSLPGTSVVRVHRALSPWGEGPSDAPLEEGGGAPAEPGDSTWTHAFWPGTAWLAEGGDFAPLASASLPIGLPGHYTFTSLAADVQAWIADPASNHGWIVLGEETGGGPAKRFDTHEHVSAANHPKLTIEFTPPATCAPDCEMDADLDVFDFLCFQGKFAVQDPYADFEQDGDWDIFDFLAFQNAYAGGC